jgi:hypothetical protein
MKKLNLLFLIIFFYNSLIAQSIRNFKTKNDANAKERTEMLDLLRITLNREVEEDLVFVVKHFKVSGIYAWMEGTVQRKDGKIIRLPDYYECCAVEALFKKVNSKWILKRGGDFTWRDTDLWFLCLGEDFPEADSNIYSEENRSLIMCTY